MPRRLLKIVSRSLSREPEPHPPAHTFAVEDIIWAMGSFCVLSRKPFDAELFAKQFPPPHTSDSFIHAARALGFRIKRRDCVSSALAKLTLPCLAVLNPDNPPDPTLPLPCRERVEATPSEPGQNSTGTGGQDSVRANTVVTIIVPAKPNGDNK